MLECRRTHRPSCVSIVYTLYKVDMPIYKKSSVEKKWPRLQIVDKKTKRTTASTQGKVKIILRECPWVDYCQAHLYLQKFYYLQHALDYILKHFPAPTCVETSTLRRRVVAVVHRAIVNVSTGVRAIVHASLLDMVPAMCTQWHCPWERALQAHMCARRSECQTGRPEHQTETDIVMCC